MPSELNFQDRAPLANSRITSDGYMIAEVRCARTGCQTYMGAELGLSDRETVTVYRPEDAVFAKDSLATYAGKPVTRGHPPVPVGADNWKMYAVGDVGDEIARDGEYVRVPMRLMDSATIEAVHRGEREISMGYTTPIEYRDGVAPDGTPYQAVQVGPIRINHLAVVPRARGGSKLRIGDGAPTWGAAPQTTKQEDAMPDALRTIMVDGLSVQTTDQGAQAIEKLQKSLADAAREYEKEKEAKDGQIAALTKSVETKDGEIAALRKSVEDATSPEAIGRAVRERAAVLDVARALSIGDAEKMSDADVRRAVVRKSLGDAVDKMSDDAVAGAFAVTSHGLSDNTRLGSGLSLPSSTVSDAEKAYQESVSSMRDAWKMKKETA